MKKLAKDIFSFSAGSVVLGGSAAAVGKAFPGYAGGLSSMGSMMPAVGSVTMMGHTVRMASKLKKPLKKIKLY